MALVEVAMAPVGNWLTLMLDVDQRFWDGGKLGRSIKDQFVDFCHLKSR